MAGTFLIYDGSGGVGSALARRLKSQGARLHLVARDEQRLEAIATELGAGRTAGDVTDDETIGRATEAAAGDGLAGIAFAVGSITLKPFERLSSADFEADFRLNALAAARAVQAAVPALASGDRPGAALLFSTVAVSQGFAAHASIAMAKGAVEGLTRALAAELAPKVRVNAIAPSLTRTALAGPLTSSERVAAGIAAMHAIPRLGEPDDIAAMGAFLLSQDAGWITGQIVHVDGGRSTLRTRG